MKKSLKLILSFLLIMVLVSITCMLLQYRAESPSLDAAKQADEIIYPKPLTTTKWGQDKIYAKFTPDNELTGCWSTALAQIFYYHELYPAGKVQYKTRTGYEINENLDSYKFKWEDFFDHIEYGQTEAQRDQVGRFVYLTACVIQKNFGGNNYMIGGNAMAEEISEHFNCKVKWYSREEYSNSQVKAAVIHELDEKRPVMLYFEGNNNGHSVVVDGYTYDKNGILLVHINMGYMGRQNRWYKFDEPILDFDTLGSREIMTITPKSSES